MIIVFEYINYKIHDMIFRLWFTCVKYNYISIICMVKRMDTDLHMFMKEDAIYYDAKHYNISFYLTHFNYNFTKSTNTFVQC